MTRRLAVYNLQKRLPEHKFFHPWGVTEAPIPERLVYPNLETFPTQAEAIEWAQKEATPKVVEPA